MHKHKNEQPTDPEQARVNEEFLAMMGALAAGDEDYAERDESVKPSLQQQRERFAAIRAEHYKAWQEGGFSRLWLIGLCDMMMVIGGSVMQV